VEVSERKWKYMKESGNIGGGTDAIGVEKEMIQF